MRSVETRLIAELPRLRAYLRRPAARSGGVADADELEQAVLAQALRSRGSYDPSRAIGPWLRTTAFRTFLDHLDRRRRMPRALVEEDPGLAVVSSPDSDDREQVEQLLNRLPDPGQEVLRRFHLREQSVAEIAVALGMPAGTVKSHLHRARRRLAALGAEGWTR